jgi:hypothetical protein
VLEQHHIALRANSQEATVWLCHDCHQEQSDRQRRAGLISRRCTPPNEPASALLHALNEGLAGIFAAHACQAGYGPLIGKIDRDRRAAGRVIAVISDERPGVLGPRPISNDRRRARRRVARSSSAPRSVGDSLEALAPILPAICTAVSALLPGPTELLPGLTLDQASELVSPTNTARVASGLAELEHLPGGGELAAVTERTSAPMLALFEELAAAAAAGGLREPGEIDSDRLIRLVQAFHAEAREYLEFLVSLASGDEPLDALKRFLGRHVTESGEARRRPVA